MTQAIAVVKEVVQPFIAGPVRLRENVIIKMRFICKIVPILINDLSITEYCDNLRMLIEEFDLFFKFVGDEYIVRIYQGHVFALCFCDTFVYCNACPLVLLKDKKTYSWVCELPDLGNGTIRRAVICYDDLKVLIGLIENALYGLGDIFFMIVRRDYNADFWH
jgi:hypothetical protein